MIAVSERLPVCVEKKKNCSNYAAMILKTEAIVLKTFDYRETSRIAVFFTKDHGKLKGILKGIRADHKKFGSTIDKFSVNDIVYYHHRNSDLHLVSQCDLKNSFFAVRQDMKKMIAASYILELVNTIMPPEEKNEEIYQLMVDFLNSLGEAGDMDKLVHIFQVKTLLLSGFRPHIDSCLLCQRQISGRARFSTQMGGLVCVDCKLNDAASSVISQGTIASILHIENNDWKKSLRLALAPSIKKELKFLLNNFLVFHLERPLRSAQYLTTLR